jgi:CBS-domain-containing membrane protein
MSVDIRDVSLSEVVNCKKPVVYVNERTTLGSTLEILQKNNFSGVPVFEENVGWRGFISVLDVMSYIALWTYFKHDKTTTPDLKFENLDRPVGDLLSISSETKSELWCAFGNKETLGSIASRMSSGIHRLLVSVNEEAWLLTQTDVIKFLYEKDNSILRQKTVGQLVADKSLMLAPNVISVNESTSALHGFYVIYQEQIGAIAVINNSSVLVNTLSASDIKGLQESDLKDLLLPIPQYRSKRGLPERTVRVTVNSTLEECLKTLIDSKVHRIWLCDNEGKVTSVITMSDIIRLYYK